MRPVLVLSAVHAELAPMLARLDNPEPMEIAGRTAMAATVGTKKLIALEAGPGAVNTALGLTAAIERLSPSLIVQVGCAGGFANAGVSVGDVAVATEEIDVHMGLEPNTEEKSVHISPLPFPLMERNGKEYRHRFLLDRDLAGDAMAAIRTQGISGFQLHKGSFVSGSTITTTASRAKGLFELYCPVMESMEGAAAAHVALHYGIPFLEIRGASNLVGRRNRNAWNLPLAFENSCACLMAVLQETM
ncbi:futalosine hydrolase [Desulfoluna butyratoxydans]|uniref:Futalosine hydrolase n=1 Tax=Desulfoluna butyratoxydans TaxID=231438 RepID=A0A4V6IM36_9BACT|nr:futalosine hydrolase [Desulfoluna butyratoxydans]VFQ47188.1 futalosine hydrolase [Desulfoluna butyratoxydans]